MYYLDNPITTQPFRELTPKQLKKLQGSLNYAGLNMRAQQVVERMKRADPSPDKNYTKWLLEVFKIDPQTTLDDLPKAKDYLEEIYLEQNKIAPELWARDIVLTPSNFSSISQLGSYLIDMGVVIIETDIEWEKKAFRLQRTGDAYVLYNDDDVMFVDEITEKAACQLGSGTQWCTISGAFGSYRERGIIVILFKDTGHRIQYVANFDEQKNEADKEINWNKQPYKSVHGIAKKVAKVVQERLKAMKGLFLISEYYANPKAKKYDVIKKYYPLNKILPIVFLEQNKERFMRLFSGTMPENKAWNDFNFLVKGIEADVIRLELLGRRSPYVYNNESKERRSMGRRKNPAAMASVYLDMRDIKKGSYKYQDIKVQLRAFEINAFETTNALWLYTMGEKAKGSWNQYLPLSLPKVEVSWYDCINFCNALSDLAGFERAYKVNGDQVDWIWEADGFRLPTEAEWEAAARANTDFIYAGSNNPDEVAWYAENSNGRRHPVGQKKANKFGLYDMSGNVYEWVYDSYSSDPYDKEEMPD